MWLRTPGCMKGYHNNAEATADTLVTDKDGKVWLKTGDVVYCDEEGYHYVTDRIKELIKYKGHQVWQHGTPQSPVIKANVLWRWPWTKGASRRSRGDAHLLPVCLGRSRDWCLRPVPGD